MPGRSVGGILKKQIDQIPQFVDEIILVSNCSKDNTLEIAQSISDYNPKFLYLIDDRKDTNGIGYGYAIQTGFAAATGDLVFKMDVDGTYPVNKLSDVIDNLLKNDLQVISCNRYPVASQSKSISLFHRIGVVTLNWVFWLVSGYRINDVLSGFYGGYTKTIQQLGCREGGWNYSVEIKLQSVVRLDKAYGEHHIVQNQQMTQSHQNYFQTGFTHLNFILKAGQ